MKRFIASKKAAALIAMYVIMGAMTLYAAADSMQAVSQIRFAQRSAENLELRCLTEAALKHATILFRNELAAKFGQSDTFQENLPNFLGSDYNAVLTVANLSDAPVATTDTNGFNVSRRHYLVAATVTHATMAGISMQLSRIMQAENRALFQNGIFFNDDFELFNGNTMTFKGRIFAARDMYIASWGSDLTLDSKFIRTAGRIYNKRKDSHDGSMNGAVKIKSNSGAGLQTKRMKEGSDSRALDSNRSDWETESQNRWNGNVQSGVHGVKPPEVMPVCSIDRDGSFAADAGLRIIDNGGSVSAYLNGSPVSLPSGVVKTDGEFYDRREEKTVLVSEINMAKLAEQGLFPANGLVYISRTGASGNQINGVRLTNAQTLPGDVTLVTDNPLYVHGDFNLAGEGSEKYEDSNHNGRYDRGESFTDSNGNGVYDATLTKKAAAVICDSFNVLSKSWSDDESTKKIEYRPRSVAPPSTTLNVAVATGGTPTDPASRDRYSGGFESFVRLHEDWEHAHSDGRSSTLSVNGSFTQLWNSRQAVRTQTIEHSGVYRPPIRNYTFDDMLDATLPPFTPVVTDVTEAVFLDG